MKKIFSKLILSGKNPFTDWKRANPDEPMSSMELFKLEVLYYRKAAKALGIELKQLTQEDCDNIEDALASTQMGYNPIIGMNMDDEPESFAEGGYGDISQIMIDFFTKGIKPDMRAGSKKQTLTPTTFDELEAKGGKSKIKFKLGSKTYMFWFDAEDDEKTIYRFFSGYSGSDTDLSENLENDLIKIYGEDTVSSNKIVDWNSGGGQLGDPYWSEIFISRDNYEKYIKPIVKQVSTVE